jgi:hypothetical protein
MAGPFAKSGIKGAGWGYNYFKNQFLGGTHHAYNPSLAIHKITPRGTGSRGVEISGTSSDYITGYRC